MNIKLTSGLLFIILSFSSFSQEDHNTFVAMNDTGFTLKGEPYFPVMFNYYVSFYKPYHGALYVGQNHDYGRSNKFECFEKEACLQDMYEDFVAMKELGFNSVRIIGLDYGIWQLQKGKEPLPAIYSKDKRINAYLDTLQPPFDILLDPIGQVLDQAACAGIKVQLLTGGKRIDEPDYIEGYEIFLEALVKRFNDHPALFSYDFINEPMYFHHSFKSKAEVCNNVSRWHNIIKKYAPHQWTTVGLSTSSEVYAWDPAIVPVDFISFHLYPGFKEFEKKEGNWNFEKALSRIKSEVYWFSKACNKPWMIGETGFRAAVTVPQEMRYVDGSVEQQYQFAKETLEFTRDCGGAGYAWWQFQDMYWGAPEGINTGDYYGVLNRSRRRKKVSSAFMQFDPLQRKKPDLPDTYYKRYAYEKDTLKGSIFNQFNKPIQHAVITGWDKDWGSVTTTYSNEKGQFSLLCENEIHNVSISAPGSSTKVFYGLEKEVVDVYLNQHVLAMEGGSPVIIPCNEIKRLEEDPEGNEVLPYTGEFLIYPSITVNQKIYIKSSYESNYWYAIKNVHGKVVHEGQSKQKVKTIHLPNLSTGTYFVHLHNEKEELVERQRISVYRR